MENIDPSRLTTEIRNTMARAGDALHGPSGLLSTRSRLSKLKDRYFKIVNGIVRICEDASGHEFDTVINPMSQTDVSTAVSFIKPDLPMGSLYTIDTGDLYRINHRSLKGELSDALNRRVIGMDQHGTNRGITAYAMELDLLGVKPDNFQVREARQYLTPEEFSPYAYRVQSTFTTALGLSVAHTNLAKVELPDHRNPPQPYLEDALGNLTAQSARVLLLRKAAGYGKTTRTLYPFLPDGTIVVSDLDEKNEYLQGTGYDKKLEDLVTDRIALALAKLNTEYFEGHNSLFGYLKNLSGLKIYRFHR